jgi:hypothetical protein
MKNPQSKPESPERLEPRWPATLALLAVGGLRLALPESLSLGPAWLLILVIAALLVPIEAASEAAEKSFLSYARTSVPA